MFEAGGLTFVLSFIKDHGAIIHRDTLHSAMAVISRLVWRGGVFLQFVLSNHHSSLLCFSRLCTKMEPHDESLPSCVSSLSTLLRSDDAQVRVMTKMLPLSQSCDNVFCIGFGWCLKVFCIAGRPFHSQERGSGAVSQARTHGRAHLQVEPRQRRRCLLDVAQRQLQRRFFERSRSRQSCNCAHLN